MTDRGRSALHQATTVSRLALRSAAAGSDHGYPPAIWITSKAIQFCRLRSVGTFRASAGLVTVDISLVLGKCPHADPPLFRATFFADPPPSTQVCGQIRANKYRAVSRAFYGIYSSAPSRI